MKHIEIIPAILPMDFRDLLEKIDLVNGSTRSVQVDICDGQFTRQPSWPYRKRDDNFDKLAKQEDGLPGWEKIDYEFDLMVNRPEEVVAQWIEVGAKRLVIHAESRGYIAAAVALMKDKVEIGLALNMDTPIDKLAEWIGEVDFVQLMAIDHIGYQGQTFNEKVLEKIVACKKLYPDLPVAIDGGVSLETALKLIEVGTDRLVVGSQIFESENPIDAIHKFNML